MFVFEFVVGEVVVAFEIEVVFDGFVDYFPEFYLAYQFFNILLAYIVLHIRMNDNL